MPVTRVQRLAISVAGLASVSTAAAITYGVVRGGDSLDAVAVVFGAGVIVWGALPYVVIWRMAASRSEYIRLWAASVVVLYTLADFYIRVRVFIVPQSSTDAIALGTFPVIGGLIMFGVGAVVAMVLNYLKQGAPS